MDMHLRYAGAFLSRDGVKWECDIYEMSDAAYPSVGGLDFLYEEPLVIEWASQPMEATVCGSTATLKILSPGDRTYSDLYSTKPCQVRLDVYRQGALYWSGCLDPEFYEEPYSAAKGYEVSLTFSDFGVLDRIPYSLSGVVTFGAIVLGALKASGVKYVNVDESMTTTTYAGIGPIDGKTVEAKLSSLAVHSGNFYDEDGVASSWREVLEGICRPMAWKMVQRAGRIWIFDLNGLYTLGTTKAIRWSYNDQRLGVGKVYNDIVVSFSPYDGDGHLSEDFSYGDEKSSVYSNLGNSLSTVVKNGTTSVAGIECYSYFDRYSKENLKSTDQYHLIDFTIFISRDSEKCKGIVIQQPGESACRPFYFHVTPVLGGEECEGVAAGFYSGGQGSLGSGLPVRKGYSAGAALGLNASVGSGVKNGRWLMRTGLMPVPAASPSGNDYYIRLKLETLFDARYNPFNSDDDNEKGNQEDVSGWAPMCYIPVAVELLDASGNAIYHWTNRELMTYAENGGTVEATCGSWKKGAAAWDDAWLAYYAAQKNIARGKILGSWMTNRQNFGRVWYSVALPWYLRMGADGKLAAWRISPTFLKLEEGQYLPLPPVAGSLRVTVGWGVFCSKCDSDKADFSDSAMATKGGYDKIRWSLYKVPEIDLVSADSAYTVAKIGDVEYRGVASADAKDDLELDEIVGTVNDGVQHPAARGAILQNDGSPVSGLQINEMTRAGVTDHPEQLLIGTLHSQYAGRKTKLSGTADLLWGVPACITDASQPAGTKFLLTGDRQDTRDGTAEVELTEFRPDEYEQEGKE